MTQNRNQLMGTAPIGKLLLQFSIPAIIGMIVQATYNVADRYFIGQLGSEEGALAIAGITVGFPYSLVAMGFGMLVGVGGTALFSILRGEGKHDEAEKVLGNSLSLLTIISLALSVAGLIWIEPLLGFFGASPDVMPYARDYLWIVMAGSVLNGIGFGINNFIRASGSPKTAMVTMFIGAVINIILDPIFIFTFKMGVAGAALATVCAQAVSSIWVLAYFFGKASPVRIRVKNLIFDPRLTGRILAIGVAPFAMQVAGGAINVLMNRQLLVYGGDTAISALGIIFSVVLFFFMPIFGLNMGAGPLIGFNFGARKFDRVRATTRYAIIAATIFMSLAFVIMMVFTRPLLEIFNKNPEVLSLGESATRFYILMLPVIGFQIVGAGYFQSVGKPKEAMLLSLSRQVLFLVPALLILPPIFGLNGVWYSVPLADGLASLVTGLLFLREMRRLKAGAPADPEKDCSPVDADGCMEPAEALTELDPINNKGEVL